MKAEQLDEESRNLLRRIVERQGYRQSIAANIRGHGLKFVPEIEQKVELARDLESSLSALHEVERLHAKLGGGDLSDAVRGQIERVPYPGSRLELAICLSLCDRAERIAADGYQDSKSSELAAIVRTLLGIDRTATRRGEELFVGFCAETGNRPAAQSLFNRWLVIALLALGRPGTPGDARAVALGLRSKRCADSVREFLQNLKPLIEACHLELPEPSTLGVELPAGIVAQAGRGS